MVIFLIINSMEPGIVILLQNSIVNPGTHLMKMTPDGHYLQLLQY